MSLLYCGKYCRPVVYFTPPPPELQQQPPLHHHCSAAVVDHFLGFSWETQHGNQHFLAWKRHLFRGLPPWKPTGFSSETHHGNHFFMGGFPLETQRGNHNFMLFAPPANLSARHSTAQPAGQHITLHAHIHAHIHYIHYTHYTHSGGFIPSGWLVS